VAEYEDMDPLLAAITDDALPEGARDDVVFMAEHRSARADVDVLRDQLIIIGDALAGAESGKAAERDRGSRQRRGFRRPRSPRGSGGGRPGGAPIKRPRNRGALAVGVLAAAAVTSMVVGMGWLVAQGGTGAADKASSDAQEANRSQSKVSGSGFLACARLVAEGTVTDVSPVPGAKRDLITLDVYHYYKPAKGEKEITFQMDRNVDPRLRAGDDVLVGIPRDAVTPNLWTTGEKEIARNRAWIVAALPEARTARCAG
jgi:hypothetical protein